MVIMEAGSEESEIRLSKDELLIVNSALNEICNGLDLFEFQTRIGTDKQSVALLLRDIGHLLDSMKA